MAPQRILVTGASSGIGAATARTLAAAGHHVLAAARRAERLEALAAEFPTVEPLVLDVTDATAVPAALAGVAPVDVLVNNAGIALPGAVEATDDARAREQFDTNVFGLLNLTRAVLPGMRERGSGRIINVSSVVGRVAFPGMGLYSASKFAVEAISDALRVEVAPFGIDVVLIEPGFVRTEIGEAAEGVDPGALGGAYQELATAGAEFLAREIAKGQAPEALAETIRSAVEARRPKTRYLVPASSRGLVTVLGALPDRLADRAKVRAFG